MCFDITFYVKRFINRNIVRCVDTMYTTQILNYLNNKKTLEDELIYYKRDKSLVRENPLLFIKKD